MEGVVRGRGGAGLENGRRSGPAPEVTRVHVYPAFDPRYYGFYLEGLHRTVGSEKVRFTRRGFPAFGSDCLALRIAYTDGAERRAYLHSNDYPDLDPDALAWCDVFGKVNLDPELIPSGCDARVIALGPIFPVRVWNGFASGVVGLMNYVRGRGDSEPFRRHMGTYRGQSARPSEASYRPKASEGDYVFFNGALWERESEANAVRARFVEACRSLEEIRFEGGLVPRRTKGGMGLSHSEEYAPYFSRRYTPGEYLEMTARSAVVLNNPAYADCHSWRLAESLALGKAIVSTPIVRALPAALEDGTHIHYVDGSVEAFRDAVRKICGDDAYRARLEANARAYYDEYLAPESVVQRVIAASRGGAAPAAAASRGADSGTERLGTSGP